MISTKKVAYLDFNYIHSISSLFVISFVVYFTLSTFLVSKSMAQNSTSSLSTSTLKNEGNNNEETLDNSRLSWKSSISESIGYSSNVARIQNETAGSYSKFSPSLSLDYTPSDVLVFNALLTGSLKDFSEKKSQDLASTRNLDLRGTLIWFATDSWEFGGDFGYNYTEYKSPVQISSFETIDQEQKYSEPDVHTYVAWNYLDLSVELGLNVKSRRYTTLTDDRGNSFRSDFSRVGGETKFGYSLTDSFKLSLKSVLEDTQYSERPADFTDGVASISSSRNPNLRETAVENSLVAEYKIGKKSMLVFSPGVRINKDRVFGARDSRTIKLQQKAVISFSQSVSLSPTLTFSREQFTNFHSEPENDPLTSPLRLDTETRLIVPISFNFSTNSQINVDYSVTKKDSNYAGSSYGESAVSTGFTLNL